MSSNDIRIKGARQNNLKNIDLNLPLNELTVVTGVSGSGKSSLAFDTIYAEGQRRYVETFSPYARQFLERMDKPQADRIDGIPPAIAIDQTNPVRTSRSTVGTMTELNDHLKLLFARVSHLHCGGCGQAVKQDSARSIYEHLRQQLQPDTRIAVVFKVPIPEQFSVEEIQQFLAQQGYTRFLNADSADTVKLLEVVQDRLKLNAANKSRIIEALEAALKQGRGFTQVHLWDQPKTKPLLFSSDLHCPDCNIHYQETTPNSFSFNSPLGACDTCRGFGRTIGIDYDLVVPDTNLSLEQGAIRPWQTESYYECQVELLRFAKQRGIPIDTPWKKLNRSQQQWVLQGEGDFDDNVWYGVSRFFAWLETKAYKMHIRVLLSKYRNYALCPTCEGARLKPESLLWRLGSKTLADKVSKQRSRHPQSQLSDTQVRQLPGLNLHDVLLLPVEQCHTFFQQLKLGSGVDEATDILLGEIRSRLNFLVNVGLAYLTLDRQSRTLSGGEVQRINLTTALGTSLVNTLFVLDEPSIGLHPRDMQRIIEVMQQLKQAGNTLLVVEHDPQIMFCADRLIDMGPGPGDQGGRIVFNGAPDKILRNKRSLTGRYLNGELSVSPESNQRSNSGKTQLDILGAQQHNLKNLDVSIPLGQLVCLCGVSGSGKSTLVHDILYLGLRKLKNKPIEAPGQHKKISGHQHIGEVIMVDQSPIGKTTRSNPASYVGALNGIRKLFATEPLSQERGYTPGTFSFNSGNGRCPTCSGNGFEHVEMQFLSDVYLRCPDCDGKRFRDEVLEVKLFPQSRNKSAQTHALSIADVLELTVAQALQVFQDYDEILNALRPLSAVGLDYLALGQAVPTLSGGESQRLKLAGHLAKQKQIRGDDKPHLFLFDEPTTGLHFSDIKKLLGAFDELIQAGHSLLIIEHNLDVIRHSDWLIELGPEGGAAGGKQVFCGTPEQILKHKTSHTGQALYQYQKALANSQSWGKTNKAKNKSARKTAQGNSINIHNAKEHNLRNVDIHIPREKFTVITGVSGSGKSTVAFDILFAEGQRRYLESLNAYARQFVQPSARPEVDAVYGIPPTVAIEQRTSRGGRKSTVATMTEIQHFLRLLFVKLGTQHCPDCHCPIEPQSEQSIFNHIMKRFRNKKIHLLAPLVSERKGYYTDLAKWAAAKGFPFLRVNREFIPTDPWPRLDRYKEHNIECPSELIHVSANKEAELQSNLEQLLAIGKGVVMVLSAGRTTLFSTQRACPQCGLSFNEPDPRQFSFNSKLGWCQHCQGSGCEPVESELEAETDTVLDLSYHEDWDQERNSDDVCSHCHGARLNPETLAVTYKNRSIADFNRMTIATSSRYFDNIKLNARESIIARDIIVELKSRLAFLQHVGLSYMGLDRSAPSLSGGEAQRIRLASQLGSNLRGVCYILDEPTIGLHPRDNAMLLSTLKQLQTQGNTVVVVEHDEDTIRSAEHIVDLGPGAGVQGGHVLVNGSVAQLKRHKQSKTGLFLAKPLQHPIMPRRETQLRGKHATAAIEVQQATLNNLKKLNVSLPLNRLVCISGVSGSGKSTLIRRIVYENLKAHVGKTNAKKRTSSKKTEFLGCHSLSGWESIDRILEVDQTPIGKTPRSCPATYIGLWDHIRRLYANTNEARIRAYDAGRFSFNVKEGRCDACDGQGYRKIEMNFLPDVKVACDVCKGARFNSETTAVLYKGKSIADVLAMDIDAACEFFSAHSYIHHALQLLQDVGLGYLTLGQQSPTLSGGEAQRIKLVSELAKARPSEDLRRRKAPHTLYVLDEPTVGLHMADVEKLIRVLHRLVDAGNSVFVIEHNLDVIAEADWLLDMGPEGGDKGGKICAMGTPEQVAQQAKSKKSITAPLLKQFLQQRKPAR
ncbi:MAG: excinuclease ABC subunit UvrA [Gammaproteobacteria bacterium]|nr:excinuclease ABC subunit UvrA [Gammaproteobacteria bacterium]MDH5801899.1 excinuclease ABC subunit UvrA [Gammaproteobacteria bacterium]